MDEPTVREHAQALCDALVAGNVDLAIADFSKELRQNLGEVVSLLPLPSVEAAIDSVEHGSSGFVVVLRLVGEADEVMLQTRWKDRDDQPTVVEVSHLSQTALAGPADDSDPESATDGEVSGG